MPSRSGASESTGGRSYTLLVYAHNIYGWGDPTTSNIVTVSLRVKVFC